MGRWVDRESDEQRLPEGMQRIGYDADTQRYQYRDADGSHWEGGEGNSYGQLERVGAPQRSPAEIEAHNEALRNGNREAWRYMLPFALVVIVFLLLLFRFLDSGSADVFVCAAHSHSYKVEMGDTCWAVAKRHGLEVDGLLKMNPGVECERLGVGRTLCVPN